MKIKMVKSYWMTFYPKKKFIGFTYCKITRRPQYIIYRRQIAPFIMITISTIRLQQN